MPYPGESDQRFARRVARGYRDIPEAYHLHRIDWQVMGHLTFERERILAIVRNQMFQGTMRTLCKLHRFYFPKMFWALRAELGTRKDLCPHFHFLIAALPKCIDLEEFCRDCKSVWLECGGGISVVTPYSRQLDGAAYIAKCSDDDNGLVGNECGLMFSDAALEFLRRVVKRERGI